jgi:hypothetical protein
MEFHRLFAYLREINHPALKYAKNGLAIQEVEQILSSNHVQLPKFVRELFTNCDGLNTLDKLIGETTLFPFGTPISLNESIEDYNWNKNHQLWSEEYYPLFTDGDGGGIIVNINSHSVDFEQYYYYSPSSVDFNGLIRIFDNTKTLVDSAIECYMNDVYSFEDNLMKIDFEKEKEVFRRINPKSEFWEI